MTARQRTATVLFTLAVLGICRLFVLLGWLTY